MNENIPLRNTWWNIRGIVTAILENPDVNWKDMYSMGQLESKFWVVEELEALRVNLGTIFLCGGWYASLANMIFMSNLPVTKIRSFDIDPSCVSIAETLNREYVAAEWTFKAITENIHNINYEGHTYNTIKSSSPHAYDDTLVELYDNPDTIINTSCEHIEDFDSWYYSIPVDKLIILQSNNYFELEEHINCVKDAESFLKQCPMSNLLYGGTIELPKYNRFMLIGKK